LYIFIIEFLTVNRDVDEEIPKDALEKFKDLMDNHENFLKSILDKLKKMQENLNNQNTSN